MKTILHCDINNCFASIEMLRDPSLRGRAIAVCGDPSERRGIVLAKSEQAKRFGVQTGDALWEAKQKCPHIVFVPPHYDLYVQYSHLVRRFYETLTPRVEPLGLDECWLDLTADTHRLGLSGLDLGNAIRKHVKSTFGLTISVGVSFTRSFAKLGSDYKKPDAVTEFTYRNFKSTVWPLPAAALFGIGPATANKLSRFGINTIGQLAQCDKSFIKSLLGKNGSFLWLCANGLDPSEIHPPHELAPRRSVGHATTLPQDLVSSDQLWPVFLRLATRVAETLRNEHFLARGIALSVRDCLLQFHQYFYLMQNPTDTAQTLANLGFMVFQQRYAWKLPVRAIGITAVHLESLHAPKQLELFSSDLPSPFTHPDPRTIEFSMAKLNRSFGREVIQRAATLDVVRPHPTGFGRPDNS